MLLSMPSIVSIDFLYYNVRNKEIFIIFFDGHNGQDGQEEQMKRFACEYALDTEKKREIEKAYLNLNVDIKQLKSSIKDSHYDAIWKILSKELLEKRERGDEIKRVKVSGINFEDFFIDPFDALAFMQKEPSREWEENFQDRLLNYVKRGDSYFQDIKSCCNYTLEYYKLYNKKIHFTLVPKGLGKVFLDEDYLLPIEIQPDRKSYTEFCEYYQHALFDNPIYGIGIFKNRPGKETYTEKYKFSRIIKFLMEQDCTKNVKLTHSDVWLIENTVGVNLAMMFSSIKGNREELEPIMTQVLRLKGIHIRVEIARRIVDYIDRKTSNNRNQNLKTIEKITNLMEEVIIVQNREFDLWLQGILYLIDGEVQDITLYNHSEEPQIIFAEGLDVNGFKVAADEFRDKESRAKDQQYRKIQKHILHELLRLNSY